MLTEFVQLYLEAKAKVELVTKNHDPPVISTPIRIKAVERSESRGSNWDVKLDICGRFEDRRYESSRCTVQEVNYANIFVLHVINALQEPLQERDDDIFHLNTS